MDPAPLDADVLVAQGGFVRAVAQAALRGDSEIDDVVQDTWVATLGRAPRHPSALRAWLAGIVRRQAALRLRVRERDRRRNRNAQQSGGTGRPRIEDPAAAAERLEIGRRLVEALLALPEHYQTAVVLRYYDDLPPREVARRLGIPVETARTRVRRGLAQLRSQLGEADGKDGRSWRASALALLLPSAEQAAAPAVALGGAILMKKLVLSALVVLLLAGGAGFVVLGRSIDRPEPDPAPSIEGDGTAPTLVGRVPEIGMTDPTEPEAGPPEGQVPKTLFRGRVVDLNDAPVSDVEIRVDLHSVRLMGRAPPPPGVDQILPVRTDAEGTFSLVAPPGMRSLSVRVRAAGWAPARSHGLVLELDEEARFVLVRGCPLRVRVLDQHTRRPVASATVRAYVGVHTRAFDLRTGWPVDVSATDAQGEARLNVPGGAVRLLVEAAGHSATTVDALATPEGTRCEVALHEAGTVEVVVLGLSGEPLPSADVQIFGPATFEDVQTTDRAGRVRFEGVPQRLPGPLDHELLTHVQIRVDAVGHPAAWLALPCPEPGGAVSGEIRVQQGWTLSGTVRNADGTVPPNIAVHLRVDDLATQLGLAPGISQYHTGIREPDGAFSFAGLPPGWVDVAVHQIQDRGQREIAKRRIEVPAHRAPEPLDIVVGEIPGKTRTLPVRILDADGRPVEGARVDAWAFDAECPPPFEWFSTERTGADGSITLRAVPYGMLNVRVEAPGFAPIAVRVDGDAATSDAVDIHLGKGEIRGRALHPNGSAARVELLLVGSLRFHNGGCGLPATLTTVDTDEQGNFVFENVGEAPYSFQVRTPGIVSLSRSSEGRAGDENVRLIVSTPNEAANLTVRARVLDADTLEPIAQLVTLILRPHEGRPDWVLMLPVAGSPGDFMADRPTAPGDYTVTASCMGYREGRQTLRLVYGDEPPQVELRLEREER